MSSTRRAWPAIAATVVLGSSAIAAPPTAPAQPDLPPPPDPAAEYELPPPTEADLLHNVIYRARADGTSRGAVVAYKIDDENVNSAQPTMLPGQTFEVNTVLRDPKQAGMQISIQWPYGSNLHCEILVDDQIVAQADQFIAPRLFRVKDDPLYGTLQCGAPLDIPIPGLPSPAQTDAAAPASPPAA